MTFDFQDGLFGVASLVSLILAVVTHYRAKAHVFQLIEKVKSARNNFNKIREDADGICRALGSEEPTEVRPGTALRLARQLKDGMHNYMNSLDDGMGDEWRGMNAPEIYEALCKRRKKEVQQ